MGGVDNGNSHNTSMCPHLKTVIKGTYENLQTRLRVVSTNLKARGYGNVSV